MDGRAVFSPAPSLFPSDVDGRIFAKFGLLSKSHPCSKSLLSSICFQIKLSANLEISRPIEANLVNRVSFFVSCTRPSQD